MIELSPRQNHHEANHGKPKKRLNGKSLSFVASLIALSLVKCAPVGEQPIMVPPAPLSETADCTVLPEMMPAEQRFAPPSIEDNRFPREPQSAEQHIAQDKDGNWVVSQEISLPGGKKLTIISSGQSKFYSEEEIRRQSSELAALAVPFFKSFPVPTKNLVLRAKIFRSNSGGKYYRTEFPKNFDAQAVNIEINTVGQKADWIHEMDHGVLTLNAPSHTIRDDFTVEGLTAFATLNYAGLTTPRTKYSDTFRPTELPKKSTINLPTEALGSSTLPLGDISLIMQNLYYQRSADWWLGFFNDNNIKTPKEIIEFLSAVNDRALAGASWNNAMIEVSIKRFGLKTGQEIGKVLNRIPQSGPAAWAYAMPDGIGIVSFRRQVFPPEYDFITPEKTKNQVEITLRSGKCVTTTTAIGGIGLLPFSALEMSMKDIRSIIVKTTFPSEELITSTIEN